jgi:uncharacterized membrane protein
MLYIYCVAIVRALCEYTIPNQKVLLIPLSGWIPMRTAVSRRSLVIVSIIIIISFIIGIYLYPMMPSRLASHWNAQGQVNGYMPKFWGLFLMPMISVAMLVLFVIIPQIDPLQKNIKRFVKYYEWFVILIIAFMFYIYLITIVWNLGYQFNLLLLLLPALGVLFYSAGVLIAKAKRNWSIGIRTPWTLSSDVVWEKTHRLGAVLFKIAGIITILGVFFQRYAFAVFFTAIMSAAIVPIVYSYFAYQKERKR